MDHENKTSMSWNSVSIVFFLTLSLCLISTVPGNQCYEFGPFKKAKPPHSFSICVIQSSTDIFKPFLLLHGKIFIRRCHLNANVTAAKNYEKSEILSYLQANKLASYSFMDAWRRYETPGSETKDVITHGTAGSMNFMFTIFPLHPESHGCEVEEWFCLMAQQP